MWSYVIRWTQLSPLPPLLTYYCVFYKLTREKDPNFMWNSLIRWTINFYYLTFIIFFYFVLLSFNFGCLFPSHSTFCPFSPWYFDLFILQLLYVRRRSCCLVGMCLLWLPHGCGLPIIDVYVLLLIICYARNLKNFLAEVLAVMRRYTCGRNCCHT